MPDALSKASDAELIAAVRAGRDSAYAELYQRHLPDCRRYARRLAGAGADDLVSEAFTKILAAIRNGKGPVDSFRPYLFVSIRSAAQRAGSRQKRLIPVSDIDDDLPPDEDDLLAGSEGDLVMEAFGSLSKRQQELLWQVDAEQRSPAELASLLGVSPNTLSARAYRARQALRNAYLAVQIGSPAAGADEECRVVRPMLRACYQGTLAEEKRSVVVGHLDECQSCRELITDAGLPLSPPLAAAPLGAVVFLESTRSASAGSTISRMARQWMLSNPAASVAAAVVTVAAVVGGGMWVDRSSGPEAAASHGPAMVVTGPEEPAQLPLADPRPQPAGGVASDPPPSQASADNRTADLSEEQPGRGVTAWPDDEGAAADPMFGVLPGSTTPVPASVIPLLPADTDGGSPDEGAGEHVAPVPGELDEGGEPVPAPEELLPEEELPHDVDEPPPSDDVEPDPGEDEEPAEPEHPDPVPEDPDPDSSDRTWRVCRRAAWHPMCSLRPASGDPAPADVQTFMPAGQTTKEVTR